MCLLFLRYLQTSLLNYTLRNSSMDDQDLFTNLPQEIIIDILGRLPIKTIVSCKGVCKAWRDMIEFATSSHLSDSKVWYLLAVYEDVKQPSRSRIREFVDSYRDRGIIIKKPSRPYKICEFIDDGDDDRHGCPAVVSDFGFPGLAHGRLDDCTELVPLSSANGLVLLFDRKKGCRKLVICNPMTREYVELILPPPHQVRYHGESIFGFGASKASGHWQYKIVAMFYESGEHKCEVYNLATGLWRRIEAVDDRYRLSGVGVYSNGNLHWLVYDSNLNYFPMLMCFDLDKEVFSFSYVPPHLMHRGRLSDLEGRLCLSYSSAQGRISIWFMNKYGDDNSWAEELIINKPRFYSYPCYRPIKLFKDGSDMLFVVPGLGARLLIYSNKTKTLRDYGLLQASQGKTHDFIVYNPTFLSLKTLDIKDCDVHSF